MKRQIQMLLFVAFAMMLLATVVSAARDKQHRHGMGFSMDSDPPGDDCATHFQMSSDECFGLHEPPLDSIFLTRNQQDFRDAAGIQPVHTDKQKNAPPQNSKPKK